MKTAMSGANHSCGVAIKQLCKIVPNAEITILNDDERRELYGIVSAPRGEVHNAPVGVTETVYKNRVMGERDDDD